jgi:RNA polymerase sigma factor (sigma-70 family)
MGIAHNAAVDRQRRDGRETGIDDVPEELLAADGPGEERTAAALTLQDALRVLSPRDRRIVLLQAVAGVPAKDVGRLLRMPASTVHWRYRRALARLAAALREGGPTWAREERN